MTAVPNQLAAGKPNTPPAAVGDADARARRALLVFALTWVKLVVTVTLAFGFVLATIVLFAIRSRPLGWDDGIRYVATLLPAVAIALALPGIVVLARTLLGGDRMLLRSAGAEPADPSVHDAVHMLVATITARAGVPAPRVAVIYEQTLGLFAVGLRRDRATICVTSGALATVPAAELEVALAHEVALIAQGEVRPRTVAAALAHGIDRTLYAIGVRGDQPKLQPTYDRIGLTDPVPLRPGWQVTSIANMIRTLAHCVHGRLSPGMLRVQRVAATPSHAELADQAAVRLTGDAAALIGALHRFDVATARRLWDDRAVAALEFVPHSHGNRDGQHAVPQPSAADRIQLLLPAQTPDSLAAAPHPHAYPRKPPLYGVSSTEPDPWAPLPPESLAPDDGSDPLPPPPAGYSG